MSACVLDASAAIAYLNAEPGGDTVDTWFDRGAVMSTFNIQEVMARLVRDGLQPHDAEEAIDGLDLDIRDLTLPLAIDAGAMIALTRSKGLSHGDRACLALAKALALPVVTSDRAWSDVSHDIGVEVVLIR